MGVWSLTSPPLAYSITKQSRSLVWKAYFSVYRKESNTHYRRWLEGRTLKTPHKKWGSPLNTDHSHCLSESSCHYLPVLDFTGIWRSIYIATQENKVHQTKYFLKKQKSNVQQSIKLDFHCFQLKANNHNDSWWASESFTICTTQKYPLSRIRKRNSPPY